MLERPIGIGLLGLGTVGSAVWQLIHRYEKSIEAKVGRPVAVKKALVRDLDKVRDIPVEKSQLTTDPSMIFEDPEIDIVVELLGGVHPSTEYLLAALEAGKDVVTANKDVMAEHGGRIFDLAEQRRRGVFFEASVGGGIPIVAAIKDSLIANRIHSILGILNGTTNYILTRMTEAGLDFDTALEEAQRLGYAEPDPTADIEGLDAARKLVILSSIAFGAKVQLNDVGVEGITRISARDIAIAADLGYTIKLLAVGREENGQISLRVHPTLVPLSHPLANVRESFNAIFVDGDPVGEVMFYGRGAGGGPTASAVVGDIMAAARARVLGQKADSGPWQGPQEKPLVPAEQISTPYYLRLYLKDVPGTLAQLATVFGRHGVNIRSLLQHGEDGDWAEVVLITHRVSGGALKQAMAEVQELPVVGRIENMIRIEEARS